MDHRPFEGWLLNNQLLTANEKRQLNAHLKVCSSCSALVEVNLALKSVKMAAPEDGFTDRFSVRLEARKKAIRRRNFWGFLLLAVSVLSTLVLISWPVIMRMVHSPLDLLVSWFGALLSLWTSLEAMLHTGFLLFRIVPGFIPIYFWIIFMLAACGWGLVWVVSFIRFSRFSQGV
jgi:hypothetical protein